ncbi:MAG: Flp pilus assembly protein CpaB [Atopobiaceae bacterium]|jgi:Flp pilus assembly protein CpaB
MSVRFRIILSSACAVLVALLFLTYGDHVRKESALAREEALKKYGGEVVSLIVATENLDAGESITTSNTESKDWLVDLVPEGAITTRDEVSGKQLTSPVSAGTPLTQLNFSGDSVAIEVPSGMVAVSVPVTDKLGISSSVQKGKTVVLFRAREEAMKRISEGATVLATPTNTLGSVTRGTISLAVLPEEVTSVLEAASEGSIRMVVPAADVSGLGDKNQAAPTEVAPGEKPHEGDGLEVGNDVSNEQGNDMQSQEGS